ncbi:hypothetical protein F5888DRAFT_414485 [Russula emetica]|nr:hypothetical protein F5888DRAFT_414485 [Russula emetica]
MVDFHDPATVAREFAATVNIWHITDGIFIWEFFTTLKYEWDVVRGHRPYRRTIWIYSLTRFATLMAVILNMIGLDSKTKINCQAWATMDVFFACFAFGSASLLVVFRIIAIWNKERIVVLIAMGLWLTDVAFLINGTVQIRCVWSDESNSCVLLNPQSNELNIISSLVTDVVLLLIMVVGLLRLRIGEGGAFGVGRVLWNQSLIWLFLATIAEVPPTVFMILNLNDAMNIMFQCPNMVITTIAATRMYRSLMNRGTTEFSKETLGGARRTGSKIQSHSQLVPLKVMPVEVFMQTDSEHYPKLQSGGGGEDTCTDPHGVKSSTK